MSNYDSNESWDIKLEKTKRSSIKNEKNICRTCLSQEQTNLYSVFSQSEFGKRFGELLEKYAGVFIDKEDNLPHSICNYCVNKLVETHKFILTVKKSDKKLRFAPIQTENSAVEVKEEQSYVDSHDEYYTGTSDFKSEDEFSYNNPSSSGSKVKHKKDSSKRKKEEKNKHEQKSSTSTNDCDSLVCADCGLVLKSFTDLQDHMKSHTGEKPYSCDKCGKAFAMEFTLQCHIRKVHEREEMIKAQKSPICKTCGKKFRWLKDLAVHMRLHTGEMPYLCTYCAKSFAQLSTLYRHIRTHTGEKPYSCKTCGKKFASSSAVTTHQKVHSDLAPFTCNTCGKSMKTKKALIVHLNLHSNTKMHVCDQCGTAFTTKGSLKMHINNVHSEKMPSNEMTYNKQCTELSDHMRMHNSDNPFQCVFAACVFRTNQST